MFAVDVNKLAACPFSKKEIQKIAESASFQEKKLKGTAEINIVDKKEIRRLNRIYRGVNKATDALSFTWKEGELSAGDFLGQMYVCWARVKEQAAEFDISAKEEFVRVLIHGLLHLCGYDHQTVKEAKRMFGLQEKAVKEHLKKLKRCWR